MLYINCGNCIDLTQAKNGILLYFPQCLYDVRVRIHRHTFTYMYMNIMYLDCVPLTFSELPTIFNTKDMKEFCSDNGLCFQFASHRCRRIYSHHSAQVYNVPGQLKFGRLTYPYQSCRPVCIKKKQLDGELIRACVITKQQHRSSTH